MFAGPVTVRIRKAFEPLVYFSRSEIKINLLAGVCFISMNM
jgi:hypothetical protein